MPHKKWGWFTTHKYNSALGLPSEQMVVLKTIQKLRNKGAVLVSRDTIWTHLSDSVAEEIGDLQNLHLILGELDGIGLIKWRSR